MVHFDCHAEDQDDDDDDDFCFRESVNCIYCSQLLLYCSLWQWHTIDFVVHTFNVFCDYTHRATEKIFDQCGKKIRESHITEAKDVSSAKMKQWLADIREHARSK